MAKDPAFLFYSQDFLVGVMTMNFEDRGKYITLMGLMHQQGRMSLETIKSLIGEFSETLKAKFKVDENGMFYNSRLEKETEKRNSFTKSRRDNLNSAAESPDKKEKPIKAKKQRSKKNVSHMAPHMASHMDTHMDDHMASHMENENVIENKNEDVIEVEIVGVDENKSDYRNYIDFFNQTFSRKFKGSDENERKFNSLIKKGYSLEDFKTAIENGFNNKFHRDHNYQWFDPDFFTRSEKLEKFINLPPPQHPDVFLDDTSLHVLDLNRQADEMDRKQERQDQIETKTG